MRLSREANSQLNGVLQRKEDTIKRLQHDADTLQQKGFLKLGKLKDLEGQVAMQEQQLKVAPTAISEAEKRWAVVSLNRPACEPLWALKVAA